MSSLNKKYSTTVEYVFRNGGGNLFLTLNTTQIITDGALYFPLDAAPNVYLVDPQKIISALPSNFIKRAPYRFCMCMVRTDERPFFFPTISTYFLAYQRLYSAYVIALRDSQQID